MSAITGVYKYDVDYSVFISGFRMRQGYSVSPVLFAYAIDWILSGAVTS